MEKNKKSFRGIHRFLVVYIIVACVFLFFYLNRQPDYLVDEVHSCSVLEGVIVSDIVLITASDGTLSEMYVCNFPLDTTCEDVSAAKKIRTTNEDSLHDVPWSGKKTARCKIIE